MIDLKKLTIKKAHEDLKGGKYTAVDLTKAYLENIKKKDGDIHAYLEVYEDCLERAKVVDRRIKNGEMTALMGIPLSIKDNILFEGHVASASSKILENYRATYDATVITKLKAEGAIIIGRTNMDEFAMGGSTENSAFGPTKNPHDFSRVPGGSSGGAAASVAGEMALGAIGTDTGGSVRQPASFCGVVALKPTYGAVSRYGLMAMGSSLDQAGPIAKTVTDVEIIFRAIQGQDKHDATSISYAVNDLPEKTKLRIGVPREFLKAEGIDKEVLKNFEESLEKFRTLGYEIKDVKMPNLPYALSVYYILMPAEVSSNLARFDGIKYGLHKDGENVVEDYFLSRREGFGKEVRRRILLGTYVLSAGYYDSYYNKAVALRELITEEYKKAFENVDIIVTPTSPVPAFKLGEKSNNPLEMYLADIFTVPVNIAGVPGLAIPSGFKEVEGKKLPLGIQLVAAHQKEGILFRAGKDFLEEN